MIVDTSAIIAVLAAEPERAQLLAAMTSATRLAMSAASLVETAVVVDRRGDPLLSRELDRLLDLLGVGVEPVDRRQAELARWAYRDFGKGSGHRARLSFGDCFSYALATAHREALLFKGDDFNHTDVRCVGWNTE